jgi:transcription antitermination factor NusG
MQIEITEHKALENDWYALHTRYQHEKSVADLLAMKGFQTFLPTYRTTRQWKDRKKQLSLPLFPGYLFVEDAADRKLQVVNTPGVCSIISVAGVPAVIASDEIASIRRAVESVYAVEPHPFLNDGDTVRVMSGPLSGIEGILARKKDTYRLVISIQMLGRSAAVEIDASEIERVQPSSPMRLSSNQGDSQTLN